MLLIIIVNENTEDVALTQFRRKIHGTSKDLSD